MIDAPSALGHSFAHGLGGNGMGVTMGGEMGEEMGEGSRVGRSMGGHIGEGSSGNYDGNRGLGSSQGSWVEDPWRGRSE